jgi:hypothetical protein
MQRRPWEGEAQAPRPRSGPPPVEFFRVDPPVQPPPVPVEQVLRELVGAAEITRQLICAPRFKAAADVTYGVEGFGLRAAGMEGGAEPPWWTTAETRCAAVVAPAGPAHRSTVDASALRAYVERFLEPAGTYEVLYYDPAAGLGLHVWVPVSGAPFCPSVFERSTRTGTVTMWTALPSRVSV